MLNSIDKMNVLKSKQKTNDKTFEKRSEMVRNEVMLTSEKQRITERMNDSLKMIKDLFKSNTDLKDNLQKLNKEKNDIKVEYNELEKENNELRERMEIFESILNKHPNLVDNQFSSIEDDVFNTNELSLEI
jgi:predicted  nucleic acid-binding Zn-ribbon protein